MRLYSEVLTVLFIGHSLIATDIPEIVENFGESQRIAAEVDFHIINGAPIKHNWENSHEAQGTDARAALARGGYDAVVLTEAVPLRNHLQWSGTSEFARKFHQLALSKNPSTQFFIYETWHSLNSGTGTTVQWDDLGHIPWRERLDMDLPLWEGIVQDLNAAKPRSASPVQLVPVGQAFARLYDEVAQGRVPKVQSIKAFFDDDIHTNDLGDYFVSLVHYATVYGGDPRTVPNVVAASWDRPVRVRPETAKALKRIAYETVRGYQG